MKPQSKKKTRVTSIVGYSADRVDDDFYPTPPEATEALFKKERFEGTVLEPACGNGAMSKIIEKYNPCISFDLIERGFGTTQDFMTYTGQVDNIITNPPYKLALPFVTKSKQIAIKKFAMLLKLVFLESSGRYEMFNDAIFPLKSVLVFCKRIQFGKGKSPTIASAWFIWDKNYKGKPEIDWII